MGQFRRALNTCQLKEIKLMNRKFTWSNERDDPTLSRLDRAFCNAEWELSFEHHSLNALSSSLSDHCPILLSNHSGPRKAPAFRFENFWTKMPGFRDIVQSAWEEPTTHTQPVHVLNHKLKTTAKKLRAWSKGLFSNHKLQLLLALEVILVLDMAQESRPLTEVERTLRTALKRRVMGLAALERTRKRQASRISFLREGDANTKFFHLRVNSRRRKNNIMRLKKGEGWVTSHEEKANHIHEFFSGILGPPEPRSLDFNWNLMNPATEGLESLGLPFSEMDIKGAIDDMPLDKAPGPDGYTVAFFRSCWNIIKEDMMRVIDAFSELSVNNFNIMNTANIALLPKIEGPDSISDFRPISLIHVIPKIIAKAMALRLRPRMNDLISTSQSAFIKSRSIHDNFLYVRNAARRLHQNHKPNLLFKLDIVKAFDSVRWDYILDVLQRRGFPPRFRAWAALLFTTSTSRVLLNGIPGLDILHGRGLRQGDPLSPLLFDFAIDPLQRVLELATENGLLQPLPDRAIKARISLYADDAIIFIAPSAINVSNLATLLQNFGEVSGLVTNATKSSVAAIRCEGLDLTTILANFPAATVQFPLQYLGLPLSLGRLRRADVQPYIDKTASRLNPWKSKFLNRAGCMSLVKSVLTSMQIFLLTAIKLDKATLKALDKIRRGMLWDCSASVSGGKCKVAWQKVCRPKSMAGLGILDLEKFARALRLRWLWFEWTAPDKPWVGLDTPNDQKDRDLFNAATKVSVGDGTRAVFWTSPWLNGATPRSVAPPHLQSGQAKEQMCAGCVGG